MRHFHMHLPMLTDLLAGGHIHLLTAGRFTALGMARSAIASPGSKAAEPTRLLALLSRLLHLLWVPVSVAQALPLLFDAPPRVEPVFAGDCAWIWQAVEVAHREVAWALPISGLALPAATLGLDADPLLFASSGGSRHVGAPTPDVQRGERRWGRWRQ